jgi:hypothetical protein
MSFLLVAGLKFSNDVRCLNHEVTEHLALGLLLRVCLGSDTRISVEIGKPAHERESTNFKACHFISDQPLFKEIPESFIMSLATTRLRNVSMKTDYSDISRQNEKASARKTMEIAAKTHKP